MLWLKSFHVIFMVSWFAALFYLPRLFVYHCELRPDDVESHARFGVMERKLYGIGLIAMIGTWLFAIALLVANHGYLQGGGWLHAKIVLALLLSGEGTPPKSIETTAKVSIVVGDDGPTITKITLDSKVDADVSAAKIDELGANAKANCPVSKALAGVADVSLTIAKA